MTWFKERCLLLWEAASHRKLLLTLAAMACLLLGTVDQLKELAQKTISHWIALPQSAGGGLIFGSPSWLWGVALFFLLVFLWMLETSLKFQRALKPSIDVLFNPDIEGIVKTRTQVYEPDGKGGVKVRDDEATFIRITLIALSQKAVKGCAVFLTKLEKQLNSTDPFIEIPLRGALCLNQAPIDVYPRVPTTVDFLKSGRFENKLEGSIPWPFRLDGALNDKGKYILTMEVVGDDIAKDIRVEINWAGHWDAITGRKV